MFGFPEVKLRTQGITSAPAVFASGKLRRMKSALTAAFVLTACVSFAQPPRNDLVATTLGLDREQREASPLTAADPAVVELMRRTIDAAHEAGITVEICGEAAGEPELTALLVDLGVDELSVSPARLDAVRDAICRSGEVRDELGELRDGRGGVVA